MNCWYQAHCNWNVYVKDGVVFREEQVAAYPRTNADVPDFNPRGCQKGACYSQRMYDAGRLQYPLKRAGERGEGKWKRISWDQALREIADQTIDVLRSSGPAGIVWDFGTQVTNGCHGIGLHRTGMVLDTPILDMNAEIGDHHPGTVVTTGKEFGASSADDMFYSDLVLLWGGNPVYTQIPNAHFISEARYNGATIVSIAPDFNASSIHADLWVPVEPGTDAALGLAMAQVMIAENLHDEGFIREQSDFPLLVRKDTRRFLRESDLESGGAEDVFYVFDRASGEIREAPKWTLDLEDLDPALEGEYKIVDEGRRRRSGARLRALPPPCRLLHAGGGEQDHRDGSGPDPGSRPAHRARQGRDDPDPGELLQVLSRPRDGASSDPGDDAGWSVREERQWLRRLPDALSGKRRAAHRVVRQPVSEARDDRSGGDDGSGDDQGQAQGLHQRDVHLRGRARGVQEGGLPRNRDLPASRGRPRRELGPIARVGSVHEARSRGVPRRVARERLAVRPHHGTQDHVRGGREYVPAGPRLRQALRQVPARTGHAGDRGLAHEQHGASQRLRAPGRLVLREGRHHLVHPDLPVRTRVDPCGRSSRRIEDRLGVPRSAAQDHPGARSGAWTS